MPKETTKAACFFPPSPLSLSVRSSDHRHGDMRGAGLFQDFGGFAASRAGRKDIIDEQYATIANEPMKPNAKRPANVADSFGGRQFRLRLRFFASIKAKSANGNAQPASQNSGNRIGTVHLPPKPMNPMHGYRNDYVRSEPIQRFPPMHRQKLAESNRNRFSFGMLHPRYKRLQLSMIIAQCHGGVEAKPRARTGWATFPIASFPFDISPASFAKGPNRGDRPS
jgi:hypothetical protein